MVFFGPLSRCPKADSGRFEKPDSKPDSGPAKSSFLGPLRQKMADRREPARDGGRAGWHPRSACRRVFGLAAIVFALTAISAGCRRPPGRRRVAGDELSRVS